MPIRQAYCTNFGNCEQADKKIPSLVPDGADPRCPKCGQPLTLAPTASSSGSGPLMAVGALLALLAVGGIAVAAWNASRHPRPPAPPAGVRAVATGSTPTPGALPAAVGVDDVLMYYERSDEKWLQKASESYNQNREHSRIVLDYRGSREGFRDVLDGKGQPVIWNPADTYWTDKLTLEWRKSHPSGVIDQTRVILTTKLVLAMAPDRAARFSEAMREPRFQGRTWGLIRVLATSGWAAVGGDPGWGKLKLAQSDPTKSNSGMTALGLMYQEYRKGHPRAATTDSGYLAMMRDVESAVNGRFVETTSKTLDALIQRPNETDIALCYETSAISAIKSGKTSVRIVYPQPTVDVKFPAALLKGSWVTPARKQTANEFVDFLLSRDMQIASIDNGFRPPTIRREVDDALGTSALAAAGVVTDPNTRELGLNVATLDDLVYQWTRTVVPR